MTEIDCLRLDFAQAIARPGGKAMLLTPENRSDGWVPLEEAVASGRAYAVELAQDMFALDADSPVLRAQTLRLADQLHVAGLRTVLVESGRPDHLHCFARSADSLLLGAVAAEARGVGLNVPRAIRPP